MKTMDCRVLIETRVWADVNVPVKEDGTIDESVAESQAWKRLQDGDPECIAAFWDNMECTEVEQGDIIEQE